MGTRGLIKVVKDGKEVISQYTQFDCYPTERGRQVCEFVRINDMDYFADAIDSRVCEPHSDEFTEKEDRDFRNAMEKAEELSLGSDMSTYEALCYRYNAGKITSDEFYTAVQFSRLIGPDILKAIMTYYGDFHPCVTTDDTWIEGIYCVNLDSECVEMDYHGRKRSYPFGKLKKMDYEELKNEMKDFEEEEDY